MPGPGTWSAGDVLTADDLNAIGVWTSYTPTLTQSAGVACTVNYAEYFQINKMVCLNVDLQATAAGTAASAMQVSLPVTGVTGSGRGSGFFYDASLTDVRLTTVFLSSSTAVRFLVEESTSVSDGLGTNPSLALASGDVLSFSLIYEAS